MYADCKVRTHHIIAMQYFLVRRGYEMCFQSAHDKTSKACQRRVMYVMKNPQTKLNVDVYVGEALQDAVSHTSVLVVSPSYTSAFVIIIMTVGPVQRHTQKER